MIVFNTPMMIKSIVVIFFLILIITVIVKLLILIVKALKKYINSSEVREDKNEIKKSLGQVIKKNRMECNMTQEFVAEALGISRQSVSKWENGIADPSTSNLIALAKLFDIDANVLLKGVV